MMLKKIYFVAIVAIVIMLGFQSCDSNDEASGTASIQLKLVDAPGDYLEVNVNIVDIQYNNGESEEGWMSFGEPEDYPINVNLTTLVAGNSLLLADQIIPSGMLKQIRLVLGDGNTIVVEGDDKLPSLPLLLTTPSAQQSGLKLKLDAELEAGFSYTFVLDWDVQKSIVKTGSDKYILKPVIRVNAEVNSGSIAGNVTGEVLVDGLSVIYPLENAIIGVYTTDDLYVTESRTNVAGDFLIQGLDSGNYILKIMDQEAYGDYVSIIPIEVTVGTVNTIDPIVLMIPTI